MIVILGIIIGTYVFFMLFLRFGMGKLRERETEHFTASAGFSIIVSFRNAAHTLAPLMESIVQLDYPRGQFEVLFVNDASEDGSLKICQTFLEEHPDIDGSILSASSRSYFSKQEAISKGIQTVAHPYIFTTDSDCTLPPGLLAAYNAQLLNSKADMLVGPMGLPEVNMRDHQGFLYNFQALYLMSLQAATQGGFGVGQAFLCNGANLCYSKEGFDAVDGFRMDDKTLNSDETILMQKFLQEGYRVDYIKNREAVVRKQAIESWSHFLDQRVDWSLKFSSQSYSFGKGIGLLVILANLVLVLGIPAMVIDALEPPHYFIAFVFKFNVDFILLYGAASFLKMESPMKSYLWCSVFYPFFCTWVALRSTIFPKARKGDI